MWKHIRILGKRYCIVPSLENMCLLEAETQVNLILGVPANKIDLRFMRATISNIIEDEHGNHISDEVLEMLYQSDISEAQKVFGKVYSEMYTLPKPEKKPASKNRYSLHRMMKILKGLWLILWRRG